MALVGAVDMIRALSPFFRKAIPSSLHNFCTVPEIDFVNSSCVVRNLMTLTITYCTTKYTTYLVSGSNNVQGIG